MLASSIDILTYCDLGNCKLKVWQKGNHESLKSNVTNHTLFVHCRPIAKVRLILPRWLRVFIYQLMKLQGNLTYVQHCSRKYAVSMEWQGGPSERYCSFGGR